MGFVCFPFLDMAGGWSAVSAWGGSGALCGKGVDASRVGETCIPCVGVRVPHSWGPKVPRVEGYVPQEGDLGTPQ